MLKEKRGSSNWMFVWLIAMLVIHANFQTQLLAQDANGFSAPSLSAEIRLITGLREAAIV